MFDGRAEGVVRRAPLLAIARRGWSKGEQLAIGRGEAQGATDGADVSDEGAAGTAELEDERPGVAERGRVAGLPFVAEGAVLCLERGEQSIDG